MASNSAPVLLLFGCGKNTGLATAKKFADKGYKVAAVSRHPSEELKSVASLIVPADLKDPSQVAVVFDKVTSEVGTPHVVIYNAYDGMIINGHQPLQVSAKRVTEALAVNTVSPHEAARLAIKGFASLPADASKTFIFTGNPYHRELMTTNLVLGVGKSGSAYWVEAAAKTPAYLKQGFKFYYVDERTPEGEASGLSIDGEAHAVEFWRLSHEIKEQSHWDWTFVKGTPDGYVHFDAQVERKIKTVDMPFELPEGGLAYEELYKKLIAYNLVQ